MPKALNSKLVLDISLIPNYRTKLYGSRRILGTHTINYNADFDFYFHISELESLGTSLFELKRSKVLVNSNTYLTSKPRYGEVFLLLKVQTQWNDTTADILLFTDERDVAIMDKVLNILEHSNAYQLLQDKSLRISVYNYMLQLEGFTTQNKDNSSMDIVTKQIHDLIVKSYCKTPIKQKQAPLPISPFNTYTWEKTETPNTNNKEQSWLKSTYTKLKNTFTRKSQKNSIQFTA